MRTLLHLRLRALLPVGLWLLAACGGDETGPEEVAISLTPAATSLFVGETVQLSADVTGASGATVNFAASPSGVVTVSGSGLVTAIGLGTATITATVQGEGVSATAQVSVDPSSIAVTPAEAEIATGATVQLTATITGGVGLTSSWSSADESIATVDGNGLVTGVAGGTVDITASVDGQAGVSDAASVTVTAAPPEVLDVQILDAEGEEADLGNVVDELTLVFSVEGEVGSGGRIDVLVDGEVLASEEFTLEAPPLGGAQRIRTTRQVTLDVSFAVATFDQADITPLVTPGTHDLAARLAAGGGVQTIQLGGQGSVSFTHNPRARLWMRGVNPQGTVLDVNGQTVHDGDLGLDMAVVPLNGIERVEVLVGGSTTVYGGNVVSGAIDITIPASDREGFEGPTTFTSLQGFDGQDQPVDLKLGTQNLIVSGQLPEAPAFDRRAPRYPLNFQITESFSISAQVDLADFETHTGYDESSWEDYSGFNIRWVDFGTTPSTWEIAGFQNGADWSSFDGFEMFASIYAEDPFGHSTRKILEGTSGFAQVGFDYTPPDLSERDEPWVIRDLQLGIPTDGRYGFDIFDPPGQFGSYASGVADEPIWGRIERRFAGGSEYVFGTEDTFEAATGARDDGFTIDFAAQGSGEYWATFQGGDNAGNTTDLGIRVTYEVDDPTVTDVDVTGSFDAGSFLNYTGTFAADLGLHYVATGYKYDGAVDGEDLYYIGWNQVVDVPFNGTFVTDLTIEDQEYGPFWPNLQTTTSSFPYRPDQIYSASIGFAGALSLGGRYGIGTYGFTGLDPMGGSFLDTGMDNFEDAEGPSQLCNRNLVDDCEGVPEEGDFVLRAFTSGTFPVDLAQFHVRKRLPDGRVLLLPVGDPVEGTEIDHGSFKEMLFMKTVNATESQLGPEVEGGHWLGFPADGSGLNGALLSYGRGLSIRF